LHTVRVTPASEVVEVHVVFLCLWPRQGAAIDGKRIKPVSSKANNVFISTVGRGRNAASFHGIHVDGRACLAFAKACQNLVLRCQQLRCSVPSGEAVHHCVIGASGKIVREGKVASEPEALIAWFGSLGFDLVRKPAADSRRPAHADSDLRRNSCASQNPVVCGS
jgi:hypothetical protein